MQNNRGITPYRSVVEKKRSILSSRGVVYIKKVASARRLLLPDAYRLIKYT